MKQINKVGVVGTGTMGQGIAQVAIMNGHPVWLYDLDEKLTSLAIERIKGHLDRMVEKGKLPGKARDFAEKELHIAKNYQDFGKCDLIVEAIAENLKAKQNLFRDLELVVKEITWLATNTSSLSVSAIASSCSHPERVIGLHFFNPAPLMKLVEVIPALQTKAEAKQELTELMIAWDKVPVTATDTPGFIVNRVARPFYSESLRIIDEGLSEPAALDRRVKEAGFRLGPFELMDFIGNDINYKVTETMYHSFFNEPRYKPSFTQKNLVDAGYLGRKTGKGFYEWKEGKKVKVEAVAAPDKYFNRVLYMLINEAADAWYYNIGTGEEIDLAMTKGVNYPKGLLEWGEEIGYEMVAEELDILYDYYHEERYRCSPGLKELMKS